MTKSELKTGMIVTTEDGAEWLVLRDIDFDYTSSYEHKYEDGVLLNINEENSWTGLHYYDENLFYKEESYNSERYHIIKIESLNHPTDIFRPDRLKNKSLRKLLWEPIKEVTMAEVEEKFGCKVKIVNPS